MNIRQRLVVGIVGALIALNAFFPPRQRIIDGVSLKRGCLLADTFTKENFRQTTPNMTSFEPATVDFRLLGAQTIVLLGVALCGLSLNGSHLGA